MIACGLDFRALTASMPYFVAQMTLLFAVASWDEPPVSSQLGLSTVYQFITVSSLSVLLMSTCPQTFPGFLLKAEMHLAPVSPCLS